MQDAPDHDDGPLTDLSHSANNRQPGHDHVATGPDQTDQNLHNQLGDSASNGHDDLDTVHASDGHLVAHLQDGYHDVQGNDLDTAGPSNGDDNFNDYGSLDHMSLPDDGGDDDNGAIPDGAANTHDNTNAASHLGNNDNEHVQGASNNLGNSMDAGQMIDSLEHDTDNDMNQGTDDSVLDIHQPSNAIDHSDTDILDETIQNDDDYDTTDDYVIPDSAAHIHQDAVNTHDSTIGNHSDTSPSHSYGIIANHSDTSTDHHVNTIASHSDSLLDHLDSAIANHSDTSTDHCVSAIANHSDTLTDHLDSALGNRSDTSIDHQVSAKANHSDTSIDHQVSAIANHSDTSINHQVSAIANHSDTSIDHQVSAIANHSDTSIDHQVSAIANHSDTSIDHQVSAIANHSDTSIDHQVSAIANHSDTSIDHQVSAIANHSDTLTHHHDSAIPINPGDDTLPRDSDTLNNHNSLSAHITILPHNNGMVLDSHTAINDSFRIISNGGNENNAPVSDGNSQVGQHVEGSGNNPITNNNNNTVDHNTVHQIDHNTGLLLDSEFGHIDQPGSHDGHGAHSDGHNSGMDGHLNAPGTPGTVIVDPNSGSDHNAGVYIPDTDQIHEGSGSPPHSGTDQGTDPGHELGSGHHGTLTRGTM